MELNAANLKLTPKFYADFRKILFDGRDNKKYLAEKIDPRYIPQLRFYEEYVECLEAAAMVDMRLKAEKCRYSHMLDYYDETYDSRKKHKAGFAVLKVFVFLLALLILTSIGATVVGDKYGNAVEVGLFIVFVLVSFLPVMLINKMADDATHNYHDEANTLLQDLTQNAWQTKMRFTDKLEDIISCPDKLIGDDLIIRVDEANDDKYLYSDLPKIFLN